MRSFAILASAGLAAAHASAGWGAPSYVTDVVTAYTTYCPEATMISHNGVTYTVTEATTLTISNCPCTVTRPVSSSSAASVAVPTTKVASSGAAPTTHAASSGYTTPVVKPTSSAATSAPASTYTGAASKVQVAGGLLAALGLAAAAL